MGVKRFPVPRNADRAVNFFVAHGLSRVQACAMVGNLQAESTLELKPDSEGDPHLPGGGSYGIAQWNRSRKDKLLWFAKNINCLPSQLEAQLKFIDFELHTDEASAGKALASANTLYSATRAAIGYFRPRGWSALFPQGADSWEKRLRNAIHLYEVLYGKPA